VNEQRIAAVRGKMDAAGVGALVVTVGSDLPYLIGYQAMENERITALVIPAHGDPVLVVPELEEARVGSAVEIRAWRETEDPIAMIAELIGEAPTVAIGNQTWATFLLGLQQQLPAVRFEPAEPLMSELRMVKDKGEIAALRAAGAATDGVVARLAETRFSGRTERELSRHIVEMTLESGHQTAGFAIVASGPNGASPHHEPTDRVVEDGDAVVVDFGGRMGGYSSDTTRMFVVGADPPDGFLDAYAVLEKAQSAAVEAVRPGVTAESIDAVARFLIADAGYGDRFIHRTGHGIGLDTHEHPYLVEGNDRVLEAGMAFSIEPGIYTPGEWGMRIEDIVAVTDDGVERLNLSDRGWYSVE
jgi:Xaa-Pro aminopeptidase